MEKMAILSSRSEADPLFDAYRRYDRYGRVGRAPQPWWEQLRLAVLVVLIVPFKALGALGALVSFWVVCRLSFVLPQRLRVPIVAELGKLHCRWCLFCLGFVWIKRVKVVPEGQKLDPNARPTGYISNHASWSDILVAMSLYFPSFVARDSTKTIPLVGIISQLMGCLYVDRGQPNGSSGMACKVKQRMEEVAAGDLKLRPVLLFPEGTTTNNRYLLPFRTGAFLAGTPVQPFILEYSKDEAICMAWESIPIQRHMLLVLANPIHRLTVYELPVYVPSEDERADPGLYAHNMREYILRHGQFLPSNATFADKQEYLHLLNVRQDVPPKKLQ